MCRARLAEARLSHRGFEHRNFERFGQASHGMPGVLDFRGRLCGMLRRFDGIAGS
jgi:hypothetical protein